MTFNQIDQTGWPPSNLVIQIPHHISLTAEIEEVLRAMFSSFSRIAVEAEFGRGLSGSRVFQVRPIKARPPAPLPAVVKIAPVGLIHQEWRAYQTWVANTLPSIARLEAPPTLLDDSLWGGLHYTLAGEGIFAVQSLSDYYRQASPADLLQVLNNRVFQIMGQQWWLDNRTEHAFQMQGDYDALLPVNLLIRPVTPRPEGDASIVSSDASIIEIEEIEPGRFPLPTIAAKAQVQLKGFVVTEVEPDRRQVTLNCPAPPGDQSSNSYRLRLVDVPDIDHYQVGQVVGVINGVVEATRHDLLVDLLNRTLGKEVDLSAERLVLPVGLTPSSLSETVTLPNPLLFYQEILQAFLKVNISTIHGDLNLENILVDSDTRSISLIDFATARQGHVLHDLLRLETEVVSKLIPVALVEAALDPETIYTLYQKLHQITHHPNRLTSLKLPHDSLKKPFAMLYAIRNMARKCLFDADDWTEYYYGLILYLLGALKFSNLDTIPKARQVIFLGAATLVEVQNSEAGPTEAIIISEDGHSVTDEETLHPPLPEFNPHFLKTLEAPGGAVKLRDKFYIEREIDTQLKQQLIQWGTTVTIRAPRQTGKTSLLMRGIHYAYQQGAKVIYLDFQSFSQKQLISYDTFLRVLAEAICDECDLDEQVIEQVWQRPRGASKKFERLMERHILATLDQPIVLAMDEADHLLQTDYYKDFFGLLRSWHNRRTFRQVWEKFNIVLVISTEPYLLIDDIHQSPFNVGSDLSLIDFDESQVYDLNRRHGSPVAAEELPQFMGLLNGHPFLVRLALYTLVTERITWSQLVHAAPTDHGPFGRHLRHQYWVIYDKPELIEALKEIIRTNHCSDEMALLRLLRAGLVKRRGNVYTCRCDLYQLYFEYKLF